MPFPCHIFLKLSEITCLGNKGNNHQGNICGLSMRVETSLRGWCILSYHPEFIKKN